MNSFMLELCDRRYDLFSVGIKKSIKIASKMNIDSIENVMYRVYIEVILIIPTILHQNFSFFYHFSSKKFAKFLHTLMPQ